MSLCHVRSMFVCLFCMWSFKPNDELHFNRSPMHDLNLVLSSHHSLGWSGLKFLPHTWECVNFESIGGSLVSKTFYLNTLWFFNMHFTSYKWIIQHLWLDLFASLNSSWSLHLQTSTLFLNYTKPTIIMFFFKEHITNTFMHGLDLTKRIVLGIHGHMELGVLRNLIFLIIMQVGVIIKFCHVVAGFVRIFEFFMMLFAFVFSWWCSSKCFCVRSPLPNSFCGCDPLLNALVVAILSWCSCVPIPLLIIINGCDLLPWCSCVLGLLPSFYKLVILFLVFFVAMILFLGALMFMVLFLMLFMVKIFFFNTFVFLVFFVIMVFFLGVLISSILVLFKVMIFFPWFFLCFLFTYWCDVNSRSSFWTCLNYPSFFLGVFHLLVFLY